MRHWIMLLLFGFVGTSGFRAEAQNKTKLPPSNLSIHYDLIFSLAWSPDGSNIAVTNGNTVDLVDTSSGTVLKTLAGADTLITSVDWSPDGTKLAGASA